MPFWLGAVTSGLLFAIGLMDCWRRSAPSRAVGVTLMLQASALLFVLAANQFSALEGQAVALLLLGLMPSLHVLGLRLWSRVDSGD
ncbi:MAG: hypothetical protein FJZ90_06060 [Chloroflexi bacterium]|nr:hypothetical protein [Chloroflexota bacterium]